MPNSNDAIRPYSDTTRAVLDLAIETLASHFPPEVVARLKGLADARMLAEPDAVLTAFSDDTKQAEEHGNQDSDNSRNPRSAP